MDIKNFNNLTDPEEEKGKTQPRQKRSKTFYLALSICLAAVSAAGWATYQSVRDFVSPPTIKGTKENVSPSKKSSTKKSEESVSKITGEKNPIAIPFGNEKINIHSENLTTDEELKPVNARANDSLVVYPVSKNIIKEFSGDKLVYSETLKDMRVHSGADFATEHGSTVKSMAYGTVEDVYKDQSYGNVVKIKHEKSSDAFTAYYSGLSETALVKKGQIVQSGQEIGSIGKVPCEIADAPHLHLAIMKDEKFIDPLLFLIEENEE